MDIPKVSESVLYLFLALTPQETTLLAVLLFALLLLLFVISGAEVAFYSVGEKDINLLKTKQHTAASRIIKLLNEPKELYASLLMAGTFLNICVIILSNFMISQFQLLGAPGSLKELIFKVGLIAFFLLLFGKILPKVWAAQSNLKYAYSTALVIQLLHFFLLPLSRRIISLAGRIGEKAGADKPASFRYHEVDAAIDVKTDEEASPEEKNIMKGIVKFGNISVKQIMRSRLDVSGVDVTQNFDQLVRKIEELHYSRIPVYKNGLDEVVGILNTKDLLPYLSEPAGFDWRPLIRQPFFVPETRLIEDLLKEFQQKRVHFAVVIDEFGGTSGIVTMEDILEEVIGDIQDEFDEEESNNRKLDDSNYLFEGKTLIPELCRLMKLPLDTFDAVKGENESLAGLILELSGEIPPVNTIIPFGVYQFTVLKAEQNRIALVKVTVLQHTKPGT